MFRTPSAWAPRSSDSIAMRFRSRVVKWTRHSRSRSCWIPNATAIAPIRTRAIAESLMLTRSTPASRSSRAASIVRSIRIERGGSISTDTTKRPARSFASSWVGGGPSPSPVGLPSRRSTASRVPTLGPGAGDGRVAAARCRAPPAAAASSAARIAAVCSGVVPQQPPTIEAPAAMHPLRPSRRSTRGRPRRRTGPRPAGAGRRSGRSIGAGAPAGARPNPSSASRQACGPAPQLTPITSTGADSRASAAAAAGDDPSASSSSSPNVSWATIGSSPGRPPRLVDREQQVPQVDERLDHEQVDAALEQAVDLLAERRPGSRHRRGGAARASVPRAGRWSRRRGPRDRRRRGPRGRPGRPRRLSRPASAGQAECREPDPVRAERGGLDESRRRRRDTRGGSPRRGRAGSWRARRGRRAAGCRSRTAACPSPPSSEDRRTVEPLPEPLAARSRAVSLPEARRASRGAGRPQGAPSRSSRTWGGRGRPL